MLWRFFFVSTLTCKIIFQKIFETRHVYWQSHFDIDLLISLSVNDFSCTSGIFRKKKCKYFFENTAKFFKIEFIFSCPLKSVTYICSYLLFYRSLATNTFAMTTIICYLKLRIIVLLIKFEVLFCQKWYLM